MDLLGYKFKTMGCVPKMLLRWRGVNHREQT